MTDPDDITSPASTRRDWGTAFTALRKLLADANDTVQVFRILRALNTDTAKKGYERLLATPEGGRIAYERVELAERLAQPGYVECFPEGSVGAAYAEFLGKTGYSAQGLVDVSRADGDFREARHPYVWFGRRMRDTHDIWHILTGYRTDQLGEACLVGFTYAQTRGLGWALIAAGSAFNARKLPRGREVAKAIWEGYRIGRRAAWLPGEDFERLLAEPLADARRRLRLDRPVRYFDFLAALDGADAPRRPGRLQVAS